MLSSVIPKLPMKNKAATLNYYCNLLAFEKVGTVDYPDYLMLKKDQIEIHFFQFTALNPSLNYGQVYIRTINVENIYNELIKANVSIHPNGHLTIKPWGQKEFSLLDPDNNLITFGESI